MVFLTRFPSLDFDRDGHRIAFNEAFVQKGLPKDLVWDVDLYGELLEVGGGKERMKHDFSNRIAKGDTEMEKVSPPPLPFPH